MEGVRREPARRGAERANWTVEIPTVGNEMDVQAILRGSLPSMIEHLEALREGRETKIDGKEIQEAVNREHRPPKCDLKSPRCGFGPFDDQGRYHRAYQRPHSGPPTRIEAYWFPSVSRKTVRTVAPARKSGCIGSKEQV